MQPVRMRSHSRPTPAYRHFRPDAKGGAARKPPLYASIFRLVLNYLIKFSIASIMLLAVLIDLEFAE